jgi:hypothetical protein
VDKLASVTVRTSAERQSKGAEDAEALELVAFIVTKPVKGVGAQDSTWLGRCLIEQTGIGLALNTSNRLGRRGCRDQDQGGILRSVHTTQQLNINVDVVLRDGVADDADLGVREGCIASENHEVEEHLACDGAW